MTIGEAVRKRILDLYREKNLTINRLSTICGVTQSTINNIVSGRNNATVSTLKKLCDGLEITIQEFFDSLVFSISNRKYNNSPPRQATGWAVCLFFVE